MSDCVTVFFADETDSRFLFDCEALLCAVAQETLKELSCPYRCEVSVTITDDQRISRLNKEFRRVDAPTDVLSFPMVDFLKPGDFSFLTDPMLKAQYFHPESHALLLGDIVISKQKAEFQAKEYGHSLKREVAFLTAHSMLHLLGFDHVDDGQRLQMEQKQEEILQNLGITRD